MYAVKCEVLKLDNKVIIYKFQSTIEIWYAVLNQI